MEEDREIMQKHKTEAIYLCLSKPSKLPLCFALPEGRLK